MKLPEIRAWSFAVLAAGAVLPVGALAQELPALDIYKAMLEANRATGWVVFREFNGQQWIYFTPLVTLHCRVTEIRYSINSDGLDQRFDLPKCVPALPFSLPADSGVEAIAITQAPQSVHTVSVQVVFDDQTESDIVTFGPCVGAGEASCAGVVDG